MSRTNGDALFSFSKTGALVYVSGDVAATEPTSLVWVDRRGAEQVLNPEQRVYEGLRLTRDGRTVVAEIRDPQAGIWAYDIARGTLSRLTFAATTTTRCLRRTESPSFTQRSATERPGCSAPVWMV